MSEDYAVFYSDNDKFEQLTNWMTLEEAKQYKDNDLYFEALDKIIFKRIDA